MTVKGKSLGGFKSSFFYILACPFFFSSFKIYSYVSNVSVGLWNVVDNL